MMVLLGVAKDFVDFIPGACPDQFSIVVFLASDENGGFVDSGAFVVANGAGLKFDSLAFQPFVHARCFHDTSLLAGRTTCRHTGMVTGGRYE